MVQMSGRSGRGGKPLSRRISGRPADSRRLPVVRAIEMRVDRPEWRLGKTDETHPLFITRQNVPIHSKYLRLSQMVSTDKFYLVSFGPNFSFEFKPFLHFCYFSSRLSSRRHWHVDTLKSTLKWMNARNVTIDFEAAYIIFGCMDTFNANFDKIIQGTNITALSSRLSSRLVNYAR